MYSLEQKGRSYNAITVSMRGLSKEIGKIVMRILTRHEDHADSDRTGTGDPTEHR